MVGLLNSNHQNSAQMNAWEKRRERLLVHREHVGKGSFKQRVAFDRRKGLMPQDQQERVALGNEINLSEVSLERWQHSERDLANDFEPVLSRLANSELPTVIGAMLVKRNVSELIPDDFHWVFEMNSGGIMSVRFKLKGEALTNPETKI